MKVKLRVHCFTDFNNVAIAQLQRVDSGAPTAISCVSKRGKAAALQMLGYELQALAHEAFHTADMLAREGR